MARFVQENFAKTNPNKAWLGSMIDQQRDLVPGGGLLDASQFYAADSVLVTVNGAHLAAVTTLNVTALSGAIPSGTILDFGLGKLAVLTAAAAAGATALTVRATPTAFAGAETARYAGTLIKVVPSGTPVGRTATERGNLADFGPADFVTPDDEIFLLYHSVALEDPLNVQHSLREATLLKPKVGIVILPEWLPNYTTDTATWSAAAKAWLAANFIIRKGVE